MEDGVAVLSRGKNQVMELPPGFRFQPTDEELITHYLAKKVTDASFHAVAIGEVDLNKYEPWDLPLRAKSGEKEWYFFCVRDRKYPTGLRTNRATKAGYWKATGKDNAIYREKILVGMKKTLVFYTGRAPKGEKSNWVMHEYRLEGKCYVHNLPPKMIAMNEWVVCRIFHKISSIKKPVKVDVSLVPPAKENDDISKNEAFPTFDSPNVTCFSNTTGINDELLDECFRFPSAAARQGSPTPRFLSMMCLSSSLCSSGMQSPPDVSSVKKQTSGTELLSASWDSGFTSVISSIVSSDESGKRPFAAQEIPSASAGHILLADRCLWNY
ncbi:unnamed protein product [Musa banksii]